MITVPQNRQLRKVLPIYLIIGTDGAVDAYRR